MENSFDFKEIPYRFSLCSNRQCPRAKTCLRQIVEQNAPDNIEQWTFLFPRLTENQKEDCPHYSSCQKVRYAKGFIGMLDSLPYNQMLNAIGRLSSHFSRRTYYRVRKGERLLSPAEQREVIAIIKQCGVEQLSDFDAYSEEYNWG